MPSRKNEALGAQLETLVKGLKNILPKKITKLTIEGVEYPVRALINLLEKKLVLWTTATDAGEVFHAAVHVREEAAPGVRKFLGEVEPAIVAIFGSTNAKLTQFGYKPKKARKQLTGEERALANAKMRATREKRHTMGRRKKATIEGDVTTVTLGSDAQPTGTSAAKPGA